MQTVNVNGTVLAYEELSNGDPLVFVHGSASDYRTWHGQEAFAEHFWVISYSRRYHWPNEVISEGGDYTMGEHVDDLRALIQSRDAAPAHLVGNSYGAFLCLLLAIRDSSLVATLVLAEPPVLTLFVSNDPSPLELLKVLLTRPRTAFGIVRLGTRGIDPATKAFEQGELEAGLRTFINAVLGPGAYDDLPGPQKEYVQDNAESLKAEMLGPGFLPLDAEQVQRVKKPTLLVNGEESVGLFRHLADQLEELLSHSERTEIPGATHLMHEENASAYNAAVRSLGMMHRHTS